MRQNGRRIRLKRAKSPSPHACVETRNRRTGKRKRSNAQQIEQFALPCAREGRISLVKILFATRQNLQTNSKDALACSTTTEVYFFQELNCSGDRTSKDESSMIQSKDFPPCAENLPIIRLNFAPLTAGANSTSH